MNFFRIKRRTSGGTGPPPTLLNAELAFNEADNTLYYGRGDSAGVATSVIAIGGDAKASEAPADGKTYARRNNAWTEIVASASGPPYIGDSPPPSPALGQIWYESDTGNTFIWYDDGDSAQWVMIASATGGGGDFVKRIGDIMTGALTLPANPTQPLQAATKQYVDNYGVPPGAVMTFAMVTPPPSWLAADGRAVSRTTYSALFLAIGTLYGSGDGSTTFNLPDLRGEFIRGFDNGRGVDDSRTFGSSQVYSTEAHSHAFSATTGGESVDHTHTFSDASSATGTESANHTHSFSDASSATGGESVSHTHTVWEAALYVGLQNGGYYTNGFVGGKSALNSGARSVGHTHTVAVSGTTGTISANHTHTVAVSGTTAGRSAGHTHSVSGTSGANNGNVTAETRPRNIALLACIKY